MNTERDYLSNPPVRTEPCFNDFCGGHDVSHDGPCDDGTGIYQFPLTDLREPVRLAVQAAIDAGCRYEYRVVPAGECVTIQDDGDVYLLLWFVDRTNTPKLLDVLTREDKVMFVPVDWDVVPENKKSVCYHDYQQPDAFDVESAMAEALGVKDVEP